MSCKRINFVPILYMKIRKVMIRKRIFFVLFLMLFATVQLFADNRSHLVKPGDTLYSLAKKYGVTVEAIQAANPSIEGTNIPAGMVLVIPDEVKDNGKKKEKAILFNFKKKDKTEKKEENLSMYRKQSLFL